MLLVECNGNLGVAAALEHIASFTDQLSPDAFVVVEFTIDDGMDFALWVVDWLTAIWT